MSARMVPARQPQAGFTFVELIIVSALTVLIFGGLFVAFQSALQLVSQSQAKLSSLSLATERMEYFRSLPYDDVGVVAGFPAGTIPQTSTLTLNGITFAETVSVAYVNDPADNDPVTGVDTIATDYKRIALVYEWNVHGRVASSSLVSYIVPRSIETDVGGGTARITVLNADATPLSGASVRVFNTTIAPPYEVTYTTNSLGEALFTVEAGANYETEVTRAGYSTDQTYVADATNANPVRAPFTVATSSITTQTFTIGALSDLALTAVTARTEASSSEPFDDPAALPASTTVSVTGGVVRLADTAGVYAAAGEAYLPAVTPSSLEAWRALQVVGAWPVGTESRVRLYTGTAAGGYTLIPDTDLPGNAAGFSDTIVDLSALPVGTYASVTPMVTLTTTDTSQTPQLDALTVYWQDSSVPAASQAVALTGTKIIGARADFTPIQKVSQTITTDAAGQHTVSDLEFDTYTLAVAGQDIAEACGGHPVAHQAGRDSQVSLWLVGNQADTLRVVVVDGTGTPVPGVAVRLERSGYDTTETTTTCGQVFFSGGVANAADYNLTVSAPGYATQTLSSVAVAGDSVLSVTIVGA